MREEILTFIEKNSRIDLKELADHRRRTEEVDRGQRDGSDGKRSGSCAAIIH